ncbi:hypothetical protein F5Y08DRAFT_337910 [Xylaria arbuscula]|uniref:Uncharacterized protein n=1 Tax=Xylaria arbuscula TaxID=114810 RepID=A0A9W8NEL6_9PEZI|nr:hypothetical protein F5Y08DRAFT_337910 [Xylaria arbuscula]KAJ3571486.1 hypothetical protein NPX13_g5360 [Xylaria arbuscula]
MAYPYLAKTTLSQIGGAKLTQDDKENFLKSIQNTFDWSRYPDLKDLRKIIKFSFTHITFDEDFKVSVVHPVAWTPLLPRVPYISIQMPANSSSEWDRYHSDLGRYIGFGDCAIRFYDASDPSKAKTYPPSEVMYNDTPRQTADYRFQRTLIGDRTFEMCKLREESRRPHMLAQGLTLEDVETNIEALATAEAAIPA